MTLDVSSGRGHRVPCTYADLQSGSKYHAKSCVLGFSHGHWLRRPAPVSPGRVWPGRTGRPDFAAHPVGRERTAYAGKSWVLRRGRGKLCRIAISQAKQTGPGMPSHHGLADHAVDGVDHRPGQIFCLVRIVSWSCGFGVPGIASGRAGRRVRQ